MRYLKRAISPLLASLNLQFIQLNGRLIGSDRYLPSLPNQEEEPSHSSRRMLTTSLPTA